MGDTVLSLAVLHLASVVCEVQGYRDMRDSSVLCTERPPERTSRLLSRVDAMLTFLERHERAILA